MGLGKTYSTKYLLDSNNSSGVAGQVLSTTSTGIDWVDANTVPGSGLWLANGNDIYNSNSGYVGIGITNPDSLLHIQSVGNAWIHLENTGSAQARIKLDGDRSGVDENIGYLEGLWNGTSVAEIRFKSGQDTTNKDEGWLQFLTAPPGGTPASRMVIREDGNVGVGVITPANLLSAYNTDSTLLSSKTPTGAAENGTGGGNRGFDDSFTNATRFSFTGTDSTDQGYGYFKWNVAGTETGIVSGKTYTIHFKHVATNGYLFQIITSTGTNFATQTAQNITKYPLPISGELYSLTFTATAAASYIGFGAVRSSGTMSLTMSDVQFIEGKPDTETGSIVAYKNLIVNGFGTSEINNGRLKITSEGTFNPATGMLQVRNFRTGATGDFTNNYVAEIRGATTSGALRGALLVHQQESLDSRPTMEVSDASGIFATFVNQKVGIGTTGPSFGLDVNGTFGVSDLPFNSSSVSVLVANETIGAELITNGDFNVNTGWNAGSGWTIANGKASGDNASSSALTQSIAVASGGVYKVSLEVSGYASGSLQPQFGGSQVIASISANGKYDYTVTSTVTNPTFYLYGVGDFELSVDNVSIKQITSASDQIQKSELNNIPRTNPAASLYDLIPNGAFTTTYAFTSTAGTYAEVMSGDDVITATGTYSVQMIVNDFAVGGTQYDVKYSGVMSWHAGSANDDGQGAESEIVLHRSGHASNSGITYLRTRETTNAANPGPNELKLEIMCNKTYTAASNIIFKFVRLI